MNVFYQKALQQAVGLKGQYARIAMLLTKLGAKVSRTDWKKVSAQSAKEKLSVLSRIAKAYVSGGYRNIPWKGLASVLGAFIYFINPFDLIPDFVPVFGLGDDFAVLMWVYNSLQEEIHKFLTWEKSQLPPG
jgi:uncharacterized membrane protein YkvA (DUF1232 family)